MTVHGQPQASLAGVHGFAPIELAGAGPAAAAAWLPDPVSGRWLRAFAIAAVLALGVATCGRAHTEPASGKRVITVGGAVTEIAFALGAGDRVVAVDTSSIYPARATELPQVGYQRTLTAEALLALSPDLVIATAEAGPPVVLDQLRAAGVPVVMAPIAMTTDDAARRIEAIGAALHLDGKAATLAAQLRKDVEAARARCCDGARAPTKAALIYARGAGATMIAGNATAGGAILELAGAHNIGRGFSGYKPLSPEVLVDAAPDVIVVPTRGLQTLGGEAGVLALPGVAATPAGRARRIIAIDDLVLLGFGPRLATAIDELSRGMAGS